MRLVFLGAPGVGKGTQAKRLSQRYKIVHLATGDMLRAAISKGNEVGREAKAYVESGRLVPDALVIRIVAARLLEDDLCPGFILDGFPRTEEQAKALEGMNVSLEAVFSFDLKEEEQILRLSGRRTCSQCYEIYHVTSRPPKQEGVCNGCGASLLQRKDDQPEVVLERLRAYKNETAPLIQYYKTRGCFHAIDAGGTVEEVTRLIEQVTGSI